MTHVLRPRAGGGAPTPQIHAVIARYGAWRVLTAALIALLNGRRRRPPPRSSGTVPGYLRRDVGLEAPYEAPRYTDFRY